MRRAFYHFIFIYSVYIEWPGHGRTYAVGNSGCWQVSRDDGAGEAEGHGVQWAHAKRFIELVKEIEEVRDRVPDAERCTASVTSCCRRCTRPRCGEA